MKSAVIRQVDVLFRQQHQLLEHRQARAAGLTNRQIAHYLDTGQWLAVHRGVYRPQSSTVTFEQSLMAACLAVGPVAVASHASAAWLWGLLKRAPLKPSISVPRYRQPRLVGVDIYRSCDADSIKRSYRQNIPSTNPLRALVDLAAASDRATVVEALDRSLPTRLVSVPALEAEIDRMARRGRPGPRQLREILVDRHMIGAPTPSALEAETLRLLEWHGIQVYGREVCVEQDGRYRIDVTLRPPVALEVDGYAYHWSPEAMAYDERRRRAIRAAGIYLLVYTWVDILQRPHPTLAEIDDALAKYAAIR